MTAALDGVERVYVALDCDVLDPAQVACFMPEPGGLSLEEAERVLREVAARATRRRRRRQRPRARARKRRAERSRGSSQRSACNRRGERPV